MGCLKLYEKSKRYFGDHLGIGRDSFIELLREQGLLLKMKRRRRTKTTDSLHPFKQYANLVKDYVLTSSCRLWVCMLNWTTR